MSLQESIALFEGVKFGASELREIHKHLDQFLFGLEYEFNVTAGVPIVDRYNTPMQRDFLEPILPACKALVREALALRNTYGKGFEIKSMSKDFTQSKSSDDPDDMYDTLKMYTTDLEMMCNSLKSVIDASDRIVKHNGIYNVDSDDGYGIFYRAVNDQKLRNALLLFPRELDSITPRTSPATLESYLKISLGICSAVMYYLENDLGSLKNVSSVDTGYVMIIKQMKSHFIAANPKAADIVGMDKVELVQNQLPVHPKYLDPKKGISEDPTVPNGVEVVTAPLNFADTVRVMDQIFSYIKSEGSTANNTGLHVNISLKNNRTSNVNPTKLLMLLDVDFFQNYSPNPKIMKYDKRAMMGIINTEVLQSPITRGSGKTLTHHLAEIAAKRGVETFIQEFESIMHTSGNNNKAQSVYLGFMFKGKVEDRRIEFRFFGGPGYEKRQNEIINDILHVCYVILAAVDEKFLRNKYLSNIIKAMDKATIRATQGKYVNFVDLIQAYRKGEEV